MAGMGTANKDTMTSDGAAVEVSRDLAPTGRLRASINLGNPVLAQGTAGSPGGVTVDIARELARRLGLELDLLCFDAARKSVDALASGQADIGFLAIEPARAAQLAFSAPYLLIEGVFVVPQDSPLQSVADVDQPGVRIGVKQGSAYDLFLGRTLQHAEVVAGAEGVDVLRELGLAAGAGIRQPASDFVRDNPGFRLIDERFMEIRQAVATTRDRHPDSVHFLDQAVHELTATGFIAESLRRSGAGS